uniref:Uncharacterized protein n=1 Tax=Rhizophagus irregularis (strain DAOM 181602 / DAOM 197198 / MUCL 43194) TaxID=747089 RepID=U9TRW7_RHIID
MEVDEYLEHMAKQSCIAIQNDAIHCPLCKIIVEPTIEQAPLFPTTVLGNSGWQKSCRCYLMITHFRKNNKC